MKQPKNIIVAYIVGIVLLALGGSASVGATETVHVSQRIKPLQCTVSAVQTGNVITYTYSIGCGQRVPYTKTIEPAVPTANTADPSAGELPPQGSGGGVTFLNQNEAIFGPWGMPLLVHEGDRFLFYLPGEKPNKPTRSFLVKQITSDGVLLQIEPGGLYKGIRAGDSMLLDLNNDSTPDIRIIVEYVNKGQGIASLRVFLYNTKVHPDRTTENMPVQLIGLASIILLVGAVHFYYRGKQPHLHIHWKAPHLY